MKFALYEFLEEHSFYVGDSAWIPDLAEERRNNEDFDFGSEVLVSWPIGKNKNKFYAALIHRFSGE